jgi:hypothetical protein
MDPNVTLKPVDKMTADEWRAERAERERKEALYARLDARLAWFAEHPHANCQSCFKRFQVSEMPEGLCTVCGAWARAAVARLRDREATRRLKVQLAAAEALELLRVLAVSDLVASSMLTLSPLEDAERNFAREMAL